MTGYIGTSMSGCIPDVLAGRMKIDEIVAMSYNTRVDDLESLLSVTESYAKRLTPNKRQKIVDNPERLEKWNATRREKCEKYPEMHGEYVPLTLEDFHEGYTGWQWAETVIALALRVPCIQPRIWEDLFDSDIDRVYGGGVPKWINVDRDYFFERYSENTYTPYIKSRNSSEDKEREVIGVPHPIIKNLWEC